MLNKLRISCLSDFMKCKAVVKHYQVPKGERFCLVLLNIPIIHLQAHCVISDNIKRSGARPAEPREVSGKADRLWKRSGTPTGNGHPQVKAEEQLEKGEPSIPASVPCWDLCGSAVFLPFRRPLCKSVS